MEEAEKGLQISWQCGKLLFPSKIRAGAKHSGREIDVLLVPCRQQNKYKKQRVISPSAAPERREVSSYYWHLTGVVPSILHGTVAE